MSSFRGLMVAAALVVAVACGGGVDRAPDGQREGGGGANGVGDNKQPTAAERTSASNPSGATTTLSAEDQQFVQKATMSNRMEVELGNMAEDKATNDQVKQLAEKIADDHERAGRELQSSVGNGANAGPDATRASGNEQATPEHDQVRQRLEKMNGAAFDRAYLEEMVKHHEKDIQEFERAAQSSNAQVRGFAERTLPTLREHLQRSQQLQQTVR
jgi:putative membrane protein